ncbi:MAG: virulence protein, partial [Youngiibacter sp.]|nr:virulence protein [Youngiibacter sp.]
MTINFNVQGTERKRLVQLISEITESPLKYLGVPSCAFQVGNYTIGRSGELLFNDEVDQSQLELLIERLVEQGFEAEITGSTMRNNPSPDND